MSSAASAEPPLLPGHLSIYVAFDWGEEIDLERAGRLAPAAVRTLSRRPRTPTSIGYKPPPLHFRLPPVSLDLHGFDKGALFAAEATVFDFGAVSVALQVPFRLSRDQLTALASRLAD